MKDFRSLFLCVAVVVAALLCSSGLFAAGKPVTHYLVTNDDEAGPNTATFYVAGGTASAPKLTLFKTVQTGGSGRGPEGFAAPRVAVLHDSKDECVYVSDSGTNDIAGIVVSTQKVAGNFKGSSGDSGNLNGIGIAMNAKYLYAAFTLSNTIATFKVLPGCKLKFVKDVNAKGLLDGSVDGMALHGSIMVVAYADGSIQSFNISKGVPVSNGDEQDSTGYGKDGAVPAGVDISKDGHYAIFGDGGYYVEVEVSDISSGKLTKTVDYGGSGGGLGSGQNSNQVWLSPDDSLLYISVNFSGSVTAAFFDKKTGALTYGCNSGALKGFNSSWAYTMGLATDQATGTGSVVWVAEFAVLGSPSSVGILKVSSGKGSCALTESAKSPANDANAPGLESIGAYPPRPF
jgi:hypothetical protein